MNFVRCVDNVRFSVGLRNLESEFIVVVLMFYMENDYYIFGLCMEKVVYMMIDVGIIL